MEFSYKQETFKYSFFPVGVRESNNFRISKSGAKSIKKLISVLMQFFKLKQRSIFSIHNQIGLVSWVSINCVMGWGIVWAPCVTVVLRSKQSFVLALPIPSRWWMRSPWRPLFGGSFGPFSAGAGFVACVQGRGLVYALPSPARVYPAWALQWRFACSFNFGRGF